jgi:phospholipase/carboxylesterase
MTELALPHAILQPSEGNEPHPGLVLLHGRGTDEHDLLPLGAELNSRLLTVTARGPLNFPYGGHAWYELDPRGVGYPEATSLQVSLDLLDRFLDDVLSNYPIDPSRLYVGGFSMGGAMASALALLHPDRIAGAVILSSYLPLYAGLPFRTEELAGRRVFQAHGLYDPVIPVQFGRETRDFLQTTPADLTYREYPMAHQTSLPELRDAQVWFESALDAQ